ncbi:Xaa-Pro peptidase family protein [Singulisphaera sp. Ch08]|uniref:Xaa-Pro peptidase family protein n=1 Tax=Singulisphaera sp. Ch08 TaxID=3120278 RepID=A0AAU7CG30_9BACT
MLSPAGCSTRRSRLWKALPEPCDVLILADPQHLTYFANYVQSPFVFRSADAGALLVLEPEKSTLVSDSMVQPFWERASVDEVVAPVWYNGKTSAPHRQGIRVGAAIDVLSRIPGNRIGIEGASVPAAVVEALRATRPDLTLIDLDPIIRPMKRAKDPDEVALIKRSIRAGEAAQAAALAGVKPGMTELDVFLLVQNAAMKCLDEQLIVYGDFATGPRCATDKGGPPTPRTIESGDLCLLDFSVVVHGYRGDFTNSFVVDGEPTPRQREMFEACLAAIEAGEGQLRAGFPARAVDAAVRGRLASLGLAEFFTSHSGHGLGLGHPEPPYFVPESTDTLVVGDVVALEPGLYIEGVGGMRFERNYLITEDGFETLSVHDLTITQPRR